MKKDINFLQVKKQGEDKKGANMVVVLAIILVAIIGVVGFMFGNTKAKINTVNQHITQLEQDTTTSKFAKRDAEYQKVSNKLQSFLLDTIKIPALRANLDRLQILSKDVFMAIYDSREDESGEIKINIESFAFNNGVGLITLGCSVVVVGEANEETLAQIDLFVNRLNAKNDMIKSAKKSNEKLDNNTLTFNVSIKLNNEEIVQEGE